MPKSQEFPQTLHRILEDATSNGNSHIISWMPDDQSFRIHNRSLFVSHIMPHYFGSTTIRSFHRQLSHYGFKRSSECDLINNENNNNRPESSAPSTSTTDGCYYHKYFQRNDKSLLSNIRRKKNRVSKVAATKTAAAVNKKKKQQKQQRRPTPQQQQQKQVVNNSTGPIAKAVVNEYVMTAAVIPATTTVATEKPQLSTSTGAVVVPGGLAASLSLPFVSSPASASQLAASFASVSRGRREVIELLSSSSSSSSVTDAERLLEAIALPQSCFIPSASSFAPTTASASSGPAVTTASASYPPPLSTATQASSSYDLINTRATATPSPSGSSSPRNVINLDLSSFQGSSQGNDYCNSNSGCYDKSCGGPSFAPTLVPPSLIATTSSSSSVSTTSSSSCCVADQVKMFEQEFPLTTETDDIMLLDDPDKMIVDDLDVVEWLDNSFPEVLDDTFIQTSTDFQPNRIFGGCDGETTTSC